MVRNKKEGLMYTDNVTEKDVTGIGLPMLKADSRQSPCGFFIGYSYALR